MTSLPEAGLEGAAGLGGQTSPLGWQLTHPGRITGTHGARRRSPRGEAPERAGEPDTAQVVGGSARLAADIATLETARVPTGREPPQRRQVQHRAALVS